MFISLNLAVDGLGRREADIPNLQANAINLRVPESAVSELSWHPPSAITGFQARLKFKIEFT
jgi:hypothetical protein